MEPHVSYVMSLGVRQHNFSVKPYMYLIMGTTLCVIIKGTLPLSMKGKSVYERDSLPLHSYTGIAWKLLKNVSYFVRRMYEVH